MKYHIFIISRCGFKWFILGEQSTDSFHDYIRRDGSEAPFGQNQSNPSIQYNSAREAISFLKKNFTVKRILLNNRHPEDMFFTPI